MADKTIFSEDIEVYKNVLKNILSQNDSTEPTFIRNSSKEHGTALFVEIINRAKNHINIVTSTFCKDFYAQKDILEAIQKLDPNVVLNIVIRQKIEDDVIKQEEMIEKYKNSHTNTSIFYLNNNFIEQAKKINDFIEVDKNDFRYEIEHKGNESCIQHHIENTKAIAGFNVSKDKNKNDSEELYKAFEVLKRNSQEVS